MKECNKEQYNKGQERMRNHNPLWVLGKWFKVPFGGDMSKFKEILHRQPFSRRINYIKADPTKERGWWNR